MSQALKLGHGRKVLVEYMSPEGPRVLAVKAAAFHSRLTYLRANGYFDEYAARLQPAHRDIFIHAIATTWIPVETVMEHYAALDALEFREAQLTRSTASLAPKLYQTFFAALLRILRGSDGAWSGLMHADRVMQRIYQGGGLVVTQVGPKDALYELRGVPFAESRSFRSAHCEFMRGVINLTDDSCTVREVASLHKKSDRYTVSISWI